jgi:hypothetical protein
MVTVIATRLEDFSEKVQIKDVLKWQPKQKPLVLKGCSKAVANRTETSKATAQVGRLKKKPTQTV